MLARCSARLDLSRHTDLLADTLLRLHLVQMYALWQWRCSKSDDGELLHVSAGLCQSNRGLLQISLQVQQVPYGKSNP